MQLRHTGQKLVEETQANLGESIPHEAQCALRQIDNTADEAQQVLLLPWVDVHQVGRQYFAEALEGFEVCLGRPGLGHEHDPAHVECQPIDLVLWNFPLLSDTSPLAGHQEFK